MNQTYQIHIPGGYRIQSCTQVMPLDQAGRLLSGKKQYRYTQALRTGDTAVLTKHIIRCPHCGRETPAYARFFAMDKQDDMALLDREIIDCWASRGFLPVQDGEPLEFNTPYEPERICCRHCGQTSSAGIKNRHVSIHYDGKRIRISTVLTDLRHFLQLNIRFHQNACFAIQEEVELNLEKGRVVMRLQDTTDGTLLSVRDVTENEKYWSLGCIYGLMNHRLVKRKLRQLLEQHWNGPLPFTAAELDRNRIVELVRFIGYPRCFYDSIPYEEGTTKITRGLLPSRRLHYAGTFPALVDRIPSIPRKKSIRREIFRNPALIWYHRQISQLWAAIEDPNILCSVLQEPEIFPLLAFLHMYPASTAFVWDYARGKGGHAFLVLIQRNLACLQHYAIRYSSMSQAAKLTEQSKWQRGELLDYHVTMAINLPVPLQKQAIPDCTIDGFHFIWTHRTNDFIEAGRALDNCLIRWHLNPVVLIRTGDGEIRGAVELAGDHVVQAEGKQNRDIHEDAILGKVFDKWVNHFQLTLVQEAEQIDDDYDMDLCF